MKQQREQTYFPYAYKIMIPYLILILVTDFIIGYYSYASSIRSMSRTNAFNMSRTLEQIRDNTLYQIRDYQKVSNQVYNDLNLQRLLQSKEDSYRIYELTESYLKPAMDLAVKLTSNDVILSLYISNKDYRESYSYFKTDQNPFALRSYYNLYYLDRLEGESWYTDMERKRELERWDQINNDARFGNITFMRKYISFDTYNAIGYILVKAKLSDVFQSLDTFQIVNGMDVLAVRQSNAQVLYSKSKKAAAVWNEQQAGSSNLVLTEALPGTDWKLVGLMPRKELIKEADKIRAVTLLVCITSFLAAALIGFFVSRYFSRRVRGIVQMVQSFHIGEFKKRSMQGGNDEFGFLSKAFNRMADNIEELIQEVYVKEIQKKEAEFTAMQAQINPHFLYNTLSSIGSMARLGEVEKLGDMVAGLAQFYRLTLNNGKMFISIANELQQVQTYTRIQQVKYGDRFQFLCDVHADILHYDTIKLILQPFVENCLKHAWYEGRMTIRIEGYEENDGITLKVIDDGVGLRMNRKLPASRDELGEGGYGVANVDERIKLQFGDAYGVTLYSRPGIGTTIRIHIPKFSQHRGGLPDGASRIIGGR